MNRKLANFARAFSNNSGYARQTCACGVEFYSDSDPVIDWEDGELEALRASDAIGLDDNPRGITFEGKTYIDACDCWQHRALEIMQTVDLYARQIAMYLKLEKERKQREAEDAPTCDEVLS